MANASNARLCDQIKIDTIADADGDFDGTGGTMLDMRDWDGICCFIVGTTVAADTTHFLTTFKMVSNSQADGGGTDSDVASAVTTDGGTTETLAAADYGTAVNTAFHDKMVLLDVRASQMADGDRYIAPVITSGGTWPMVVVCVRYNGRSFKDVFQATRTAFQLDG